MKKWLKLFDEPIEGCENKFVITEDAAYFVPYLDRKDAPAMTDILAEVFGLSEPRDFWGLDEMISEGRVVFGYCMPRDGEVVPYTPLERDEHAEKRLGEVFDGV